MSHSDCNTKVHTPALKRRFGACRHAINGRRRPPVPNFSPCLLPPPLRLPKLPFFGRAIFVRDLCDNDDGRAASHRGTTNQPSFTWTALRHGAPEMSRNSRTSRSQATLLASSKARVASSQHVHCLPGAFGSCTICSAKPLCIRRVQSTGSSAEQLRWANSIRTYTQHRRLSALHERSARRLDRQDRFQMQVLDNSIFGGRAGCWTFQVDIALHFQFA
ncbi:hypothetical protein PsYK624_052980 [Phanerochaete sordida]|uniref:Uncharacterized protein n=1 Tax=Phanerochaete sordida TaxID=48140 RepID=A0A9P3LCH8_9APHY|nr:hypothetical protein PsYK624_052980 [Phanerochaete sordida]